MSIAKVVSVQPIGDFRFTVRFADGAWGEWDYSDVLNRSGPMIEPLHDPAFVRKAFVEHGAPTWPNGYDVCPQTLYDRLRTAGALHRASDAA